MQPKKAQTFKEPKCETPQLSKINKMSLNQLENSHPHGATRVLNIYF